MPRRIGLPLHDWPAADRAAWARATDARDFFDDQAVAAGWRPKTRKQARSAYSRWLAYLARTWPDELTKPIAARDMPNLIEAYCRELSSRVRPMSIAAELQHLLLALRALEPGEPWKWLAASSIAGSAAQCRRIGVPRSSIPACSGPWGGN